MLRPVPHRRGITLYHRVEQALPRCLMLLLNNPILCCAGPPGAAGG